MRNLPSLAAILALLAAVGRGNTGHGTAASPAGSFGRPDQNQPGPDENGRGACEVGRGNRKQIRARLVKSKIGAQKFQVDVQGVVAT